jgi:hypothetical protein
MAEVRMLKNRKTGDLLPYNADVARHPDMDVVTPDGVAPRKGRSAPVSKRKKKAGPAKPSAARRASKTSEDTTPPDAPTGEGATPPPTGESCRGVQDLSRRCKRSGPVGYGPV